MHSPPTAHHVPSTVHLSWKESKRIIIMWYAKYNIRQARLVTVLVRIQRRYACGSCSGYLGTGMGHQRARLGRSELDPADGLPEVLALDCGELKLKLGWLAGAVSSSERACSPGRS